MEELVDMDDVTFFVKYLGKIYHVINNLKQRQLFKTVESDIFNFLGIGIEKKGNSKIILRQCKLIAKILKDVEKKDCNNKESPAQEMPLGTDTTGEMLDKEWEYASLVRILLYLISNSRPDIQFSIHQCAIFTHTPMKINAKAIRRICRYLKGTHEKGLVFSIISYLNCDCFVGADLAGLYNYEDDQDPVCV